MPYISDRERRKKLREGDTAKNAGELNYQIFHYVKHNFLNNPSIYLEIEKFVNNFLGETPNYQKYNDMTGALVRCYREIYRRSGVEVQQIYDVLDSYDDLIGIYEDTKIKQNNDVE